MHTCRVLTLVVLIAAAALVAQAPVTYTLTTAPPAFHAPVARALKAFDTLQAELSARLAAELKAGGPTQAVVVCRDEAQPLTARVAREAGMALGRTSRRLRNPSNAPPAWAAGIVARTAGRKAADVQPVVVDLGRQVGVLRPIGTAGACTSCHGSEEKRPTPLQEILQAHYPHDKAVGFAEGDLRGFFWAEVPR